MNYIDLCRGEPLSSLAPKYKVKTVVGRDDKGRITHKTRRVPVEYDAEGRRIIFTKRR